MPSILKQYIYKINIYTLSILTILPEKYSDEVISFEKCGILLKEFLGIENMPTKYCFIHLN